MNKPVDPSIEETKARMRMILEVQKRAEATQARRR